jgi:hypothetical protein
MFTGRVALELAVEKAKTITSENFLKNFKGLSLPMNFKIPA